MNSQATNDAGEATEKLLALLIERIMREEGTDTDRGRLHLALHEDFMNERTEQLMFSACCLVHDYAEQIAAELIDGLLRGDAL